MPAGSMMPYGAPSRTENIPESGSGRVPELSDVDNTSHRNQPAGVTIREPFQSLRAEVNAPSDSLEAAAIEDSPLFPTFSAGVIREAQALGALNLDRPHDEEDPFRDLFTGIEDVAGAGDESDLFHGLRQALDQNELHQYAADLKRAIDERNSLKLSLGQREEEIKDLRAELSKAYRDQNDLSEQVTMPLKTYGFNIGTVSNISVSQLQQKIEMIGRLREEVDVIRMESLRWKEGIDRFAAEKETARAQLSSSETQLQKVKEKNLVQAKKIEELEVRLASVLAKAKKAKTYADALVAVYRADAEAAQVQEREAAESVDGRAHWVAELAKYRSRRETLEEIHARGFDLTEEIKRAKELKADAEALVSDDDDDDDGSKSGSENGGESDKEKTAPV
ncbi:uncharacterized protein [Nicotiana tomentosiformis]|uniref:uncharacterized protein n=1 Tax=Nicotiana tomentosiformis TaxID=4098 RepID=UPI00388C48B8